MRSRHCLASVSSLLLVLLAPGRAPATTWIVSCDPSTPEDRIGAVVAQAASGDTLLVEPGLYYEHIPLGEKTFYFKSTGGPTVTILDGSREFPGRQGSIMYRRGSATPDLVVDGFTFVSGRAASWGNGGAIYSHGYTGDGAVCIRDCIFRDNHAAGNILSSGGAVFVYGMRDFDATSCIFEENTSTAAGGALAINAYGRILIEDCRFDGNWCSYGDESVVDANSGTVELRNNVFQAGVAGYYSSSLRTLAESTVLDGNVFLDPGDGGTTAMIFDTWASTGDPPDIVQRVEMTGNVLWSAEEPIGWGGLWFRFYDGDISLRGNTFVRTTINLEMDDYVLEAANNIFFASPIALGRLRSGTATCNDSWPQALPVSPVLTSDHNLNLDPMFCDEAAGYVNIAHESPCASENSPEGCGLIGALEPACDLVPTITTTWGRLKAAFR